MSTLSDLNKHLFAQLDRLANADSKSLDVEVIRAKSVQDISAEVISAHRTQLEAVKIVAQYKGLNSKQETPLIAVGNIEVEI